MSGLAGALTEIAERLDHLGYSWALLGGLAVSTRTEPRFTRDLDLAVSVADDSDSETVIIALQQAGYRILSLVEQEAAGRLATIRLHPPEGAPEGVVVDLLFASSGIEPEIVQEAEVLEVFPGRPAPVGRIGHLIACKLLARSDLRPQDQVDLVRLLEVADPDELARAGQAVRTIQERGFHRGRNLVAALAELVEAR